MNENTDSLIYLSLEIEGLLTLIERREDNTPKVVLAMLRDKAARLKAGIDRLDPDFKVDSKSVGEADREIAASVEFEERNDAAIEDSPVTDKSASSPDIAEVATAVSPEAPVEVPVEIIPQSPVTSEPSDNKPVRNEVVSVVAEGPVAKTLGDMHKAFTLNDKFRFRRELFHNSDEEFSEALSVIGSMADADEVTDYLYNDLCLDPSNEDVKEFMEVITAFINR